MAKKVGSISRLCLCCQPLFALLGIIGIVEAWKPHILVSLVSWTPISFCQWKAMWDNERRKRGEVNLSTVINNIFGSKSSIYRKQWWQRWWRFQPWLRKRGFPETFSKFGTNGYTVSNTKAVCADILIPASNARCFLISGYHLDLCFLLQFLSSSVWLFQLLQPMYINSLY